MVRKKDKYIRANNSNYITKTVRKEIVRDKTVREKVLREMTNESKIAYNKQQNVCGSLLRKNKTDYFTNLYTILWKLVGNFGKL